MTGAHGVLIGQRWQLRGRGRNRPIVRVTQVHRADREALIEQLVPITQGEAVRRERVKFYELRHRYRLVSQSPAVCADRARVGAVEA